MLLRQANNGPILRGTAPGQFLGWDDTAQEWFPATPSSGGVQLCHAGTGIDVDNIDPANPVISNAGVLSVAAGTGIGSTGGQNPSISNTGVLSVTAAANGSIGVDNSDPQEPVVFRIGNNKTVVDPDGGSFGPPTDYTFGTSYTAATHTGTILVANVSLAATDSDILDVTLETAPNVPLSGLVLSQSTTGANPASITIMVLTQFFAPVTVTVRVHSENGNQLNVAPNAVSLVIWDL